MSQVCLICTNSQRLEIDRRIVHGDSIASIARDFEVSYDSLFSHSKKHISRQLVKAVEQKVMIEGNELMEIIQRIIERAESIFKRNFEKGNDATALKAIDSQRNTIQLLANISAQLHAAKMAELELQKEKNGLTREQEEESFKEQICVLSMEELIVDGKIGK